MREIDINKYWIGYFYGIVICSNIFSAGVILSYTLPLNWFFFLWIYIITLPIYFTIKYLIEKQKKRESTLSRKCETCFHYELIDTNINAWCNLFQVSIMKNHWCSKYYKEVK